MHPATFPRIATAFSIARTTRRDFIRESIAYPMILPENASLIAYM